MTAAARRRLFISSVQKELQAERRAVKDFVRKWDAKSVTNASQGEQERGHKGDKGAME